VTSQKNSWSKSAVDILNLAKVHQNAQTSSKLFFEKSLQNHQHHRRRSLYFAAFILQNKL